MLLFLKKLDDTALKIDMGRQEYVVKKYSLSETGGKIINGEIVKYFVSAYINTTTTINVVIKPEEVPDESGESP